MLFRSSGAAYVADTNNNRIERFDIPGPSTCAALGSWPPPLDVTPALSVRLQHRSGVLARRALTLAVSCTRGCKILVSATLAPARGARRFALISVARPLPPRVPGHVRIRVGRRALRGLRAALGHHRAMTATIKVVAAGPTGRRTVLVQRYRVLR